MSDPAGGGKLFVISGPSAVGKSTVCKHLLAREGIVYSVSATTRHPRPGEVEGKNYFFLTREQFERDIAAGRFLEHAELLSNLYGTPRGPVETIIEQGQICLLDIDVEGARQVRRSGIEAVFVFLMPPDLEALEQRILKRATESTEQVQQRLALARKEIEQRGEYDHRVVNDDLNRAIEQIVSILGLTEENKG